MPEYEGVTVHIQVDRDLYPEYRATGELAMIEPDYEQFGQAVAREVGKGLHSINSRLAAGHFARVDRVEIELIDKPVRVLLNE